MLTILFAVAAFAADPPAINVGAPSPLQNYLLTELSAQPAWKVVSDRGAASVLLVCEGKGQCRSVSGEAIEES